MRLSYCTCVVPVTRPFSWYHNFWPCDLDLQGWPTLKQEAQRATYRAPEYNLPPFLRNQPRRTFLFTDRSEKHKLGRGRWDLASCQVSLNSVLWFQRRSRKCLSQSEAKAAILFFRLARKTQTWWEDVEILLPIKFRWIPFSCFRGEVENVSANQRPGRPFCFSDRPEKRKLGRGC